MSTRTDTNELVERIADLMEVGKDLSDQLRDLEEYWESETGSRLGVEVTGEWRGLKQMLDELEVEVEELGREIDWVVGK